MGKRTLFLAAVVAAFFLTAGCGDKKSGDAAKSKAGKVHTAAEEVTPPAWEGEYQCKSGDSECRDDKMHGDGVYFAGTVFNTLATADVNARSEPSTKGEVLFQVKKDTRMQILGLSKDGWAFVVVRDVIPRRGWVFGQNIDYRDGQKLASSELKITDFNLTARDSSTADLTAAYKVNDVERTMNFRAFKERGQDFYTFFCDIYSNQSRYTLLPGLYTWNFAKNQLKHTVFLPRAPFVSGDVSAIWESAVFSNDQKFFIVYQGDNKLLFRAGGVTQLFPDIAIESFDPRGKTITSACPADAVISKYYQNTEEMDGAISEYRDKARSSPDEDIDQSVVSCETNLETGARKIIENTGI
ncbi:MAG: SH3 domain-containing protein [Chitinispirillia bacterium]|nr:SH3 domain-containing protein [Chitinispirillia bacterium]MCL2267695.1 SH3 domain-containing protein [Chitinispirillia bacterium]